MLAVLSVIGLSGLQTCVKAQIRRSDWQFGVVARTDNLIYTQGAELLVKILPILSGRENVAVFYAKNMWWIPEFRYRPTLVQKMEFGGEKAKVYPKSWGWNHMDWCFDSYTVGYHVGYLPRTSHVGFDVQVDYAQDGFKIKMPDAEEKIKVKKRMVSGTVLARIRLLDYTKARLNPVLEIGGSYDYAFYYKDKVINDKDAVNSGFNGIIGLGFTNTETHFSFSLRYQHSFYDFYDEDFEYEGVQIFKDHKSKIGKLETTLTFSL